MEPKWEGAIVYLMSPQPLVFTGALGAVNQRLYFSSGADYFETQPSSSWESHAWPLGPLGPSGARDCPIPLHSGQAPCPGPAGRAELL